MPQDGVATSVLNCALFSDIILVIWSQPWWGYPPAQRWANTIYRFPGEMPVKHLSAHQCQWVTKKEKWYTEELKHLGSREVACVMDSSEASVILCKTDLKKNTCKHSFCLFYFSVFFFFHSMRNLLGLPLNLGLWGLSDLVGYTSAQSPPESECSFLA